MRERGEEGGRSGGTEERREEGEEEGTRGQQERGGEEIYSPRIRIRIFRSILNPSLNPADLVKKTLFEEYKK